MEWILETHAHAHHLSAASVLKYVFNAKTGIGENIKKLLSYWLPIFNTAIDTPTDGSQFDILFADGDQFKIGQLIVKRHIPQVLRLTVLVTILIMTPYL